MVLKKCDKCGKYRMLSTYGNMRPPEGQLCNCPEERLSRGERRTCYTKYTSQSARTHNKKKKK